MSYSPTQDMSGGWADAGDNIKFTLTNAWAAYALLKAYDAFPDAHLDLYGSSYKKTSSSIGTNGDGIADILNEVKWSTDYLLKLHLDDTTLVSQIGDARDHNHPLTCPTMTKSGEHKGGDPRTVWFGESLDNTNGTKADILGITAATLALMAQVNPNKHIDHNSS